MTPGPLWAYLLVVHFDFSMSQQHLSLDYRPPGREPGALDEGETWWVERQEALEVAGYMLRPRYRPGWIPSWRGTNKFYRHFEDGQNILVSTFYTFLVSVSTNFLRCAWVWTPREYLTGDLWY